MENMLIKIFDNIICKEPEYTEMAKRYDEEVEKIIAPLHEKMPAGEVEKIRGLIYKATYYAQRDGFVLGARMMAQIICETTVIEERSVKR